MAPHSISLERLVALAPPAPEQWVAIADELLQAVGREGAAAAGLKLDVADIRVTAAGEVTIASRQRPAADSSDEVGVQAVGHLVCEALQSPDSTAGAADPIVLVTLHALAIGALGRTAPTAVNSLRAQLAALTSEGALAARREERALAVEQIRRGTLPQRAERVRTLRQRSPRRVPLLGGLAAVVLVAVPVLVLGTTAMWRTPSTVSRPAPVPTEQVARAPISEATPDPVPVPTAATPPAPGPAAAGQIRSVSLSIPPSCERSLICSGTIELRFAGAAGPTALAWSVVFYDPCETAPTTVTSGSFKAPAGWNTVIANSSFVLPATTHRGWLVAVTSNPAQAASGPVEIAGPPC